MKKTTWTHILAIIGVIAYEQLSILLFHGKLLTGELVYYIIQVPFFYIYAEIMFQIRSRQISWIKGLSFSISALLLYFILHSITSSIIILSERGQYVIESSPLFYKRMLVRCFYIIGISFAYFQARFGIRKARLALQRELQLMEQERNQAELENAFLRSQINPHLLFNSLQFIQYQIDKGSPKASQAVQLLGELMHYSLKATSESNTVPLVDELAYVRQYVELASLRSDNRQHLQLNVNAEANSSNLQLPSGILGNLVENVFKHGDLSEPNDPGMVVIELQDRKLFVQTHNRKRPISPYRITGIGMDNIRKRLDLLYPEHYTFRSWEEHSHYNIYFEIIL